jgi:predicted alpha/beta hydrolase
VTTRTPQRLRCEDGEPISATLFSPKNVDAGRPVLIINNAIGKCQEGYWETAVWWVAKGWQVVTYDYRGIGASRALRRQTGQFRLWEWGEQDLTAVLRWVRQDFPSAATVVLGHSMGGQILQFCEHLDWIDAAVFVAGQKGYWRNWDNAYRLPLLGFWHFLPIYVCLFGKFHLMNLAGCESLPRKIALDWAKWGRCRDFVDEWRRPLPSHGALLRCPLLSISIADDPLFGPKPAVDALLEWYPNALTERQHLVPEAIGIDRVGHTGLFEAGKGELLWPSVLDWLGERQISDRRQFIDASASAKSAENLPGGVGRPHSLVY